MDNFTLLSPSEAGSSALEAAMGAWLDCADLRRRRDRLKRFTYGDQWGDVEPGPDGLLTDGQRARLAGHHPLTNNLVRQLVKTIVGIWRRDYSPGLPQAPAELSRINALPELDARMLEEFLISGCAVQRVVTERRPAGTGVWVDNVSPDAFFTRRFTDPRGLDMDCLGMLHSMTPREVVARFAPGSRRSRRLRALYAGTDGYAAGAAAAGLDEQVRFATAPPGRWRVVELWTLEGERWLCRWLTPDGVLLDAYHSPWPHGSHPFAVKLYPLTDGEVHPFVEDVIEQQRIVNRLITLLDTMLSVSAKGALLYPVTCTPHGMPADEIARRWAQPGAIIPFMPQDGGEEPRQISGPASDCGASQLLAMQLKLFEQISGVNSAIQGRDVTANTSAALYEARTRNATTALVDVLESYASFIDARNRLMENA